MADKLYRIARISKGDLEKKKVNNPQQISPQELYNSTKYYIFPDEKIAKESLLEINKRLGYKKDDSTTNWCDIEPHPTSQQCLLSYTDRIEHCRDIFEGYECLSRHETIKRGWFFGFHKGRYAKLIAKLEEAELLYQEIKLNYGNSFFPIQKALFLSFAYACYSIREILFLLSSYKNKVGKVKNQKSSEMQQSWWKEKWDKELNVKGELLHYFNEIHNSDKHSTSLYIAPLAKYFQNDGQCLICFGNQYLNIRKGKIYMGSEGFFEIEQSDGFFLRKTSQEQWELLSLHNIYKVEYEFELINVPRTHLGEEISGTTLDLIEIVRNYYTSLIKEVVVKFP